MKIGEAITYDGVYFGRMKHFALWNKELDSSQIKEGMHIDLTSGHSASANLLFTTSLIKAILIILKIMLQIQLM